MSSEQKIMQCHLCTRRCPQAEMASEISKGRMFATKELIACQKELEAYRELEHKLNGVDLTMLVNTFMEMAAEGEVQGYQRGHILTNEDADKWDAYLSIGTPEECRTAVEKQKAKKATDIHVDEHYCPACGSDNTTSGTLTVGDRIKEIKICANQGGKNV